jgi:hypothetical protein
LESDVLTHFWTPGQSKSVRQGLGGTTIVHTSNCDGAGQMPFFGPSNIYKNKQMIFLIAD